MIRKIMLFIKIIIKKVFHYHSSLFYRNFFNYNSLPGMPDLYFKKVRMFKNEKIQKEAIIFVGDSITEGGDWSTLLDISIINRGIAGDVSSGILHRIKEVAIRKPSQVFLMIGINDLMQKIHPDRIIENYQKIIDSLSYNNTSLKIYLLSVLPVNPCKPGFPKGYDLNIEILLLNEQIKILSKKNKNTRFINLHPILSGLNGLLREDCTVDGLHLNNNGYNLWTDYIKKERLTTVNK